MDAYNPALADKAVHLQNILLSNRFFYIVFVIWTFASLIQKQTQSNNVPRFTDKEKTKARQLRESLVFLGVTFIKLGQFLSMRPDIFPSPLTEELSLLQDQVPPFPFEQVKTITEKELAQELFEIFNSFENKPMASASIGQVHRATLKDGRPVAVKVQRPGIVKAIYQDLGVMRLIARWAKAWHIKGDWQGWLDLTDEFGHTLFAEMNYLQEGRHADRLRTILRNFPSIIIPRIIWPSTTKKVLTEELCLGIKIDNLQSTNSQNIDLKRLSNQLVDAYLEQVFLHGYFHADPHTGNFAISPAGQVIIYDFGMVGSISNAQRVGLLNILISIIKNDTEAFIAALEQTGIIVQISQENKERLQKAVQPFLAFCQGSTSNEIDLSQLEKEIDILLKSQSFKLPANLAYLIRTVVSLEGFIRMLNPDFNFIRATKPHFKRLAINHLI